VGLLTLDASLTAAPDSGDAPFPTSSVAVAPQLTPACKPFVTQAGGTFALNSPSSFQALAGVGASSQVTAAHTLYVNTGGVAVQMRLTTLEGAQVVPLAGVGAWEFPVGDPLTLVEAMGNTAIEWYAWGNA
jgi:hypothetical protein